MPAMHLQGVRETECYPTPSVVQPSRLRDALEDTDAVAVSL